MEWGDFWSILFNNLYNFLFCSPLIFSILFFSLEKIYSTF